uniref:Uncharacterized protein n=1 Tax=Peromyscus maniculatus bairdii TaxID=230844 RepID=A0A8C8UMA0_PERMB
MKYFTSCKLSHTHNMDSTLKPYLSCDLFTRNARRLLHVLGLLSILKCMALILKYGYFHSLTSVSTKVSCE